MTAPSPRGQYRLPVTLGEGQTDRPEELSNEELTQALFQIIELYGNGLLDRLGNAERGWSTSRPIRALTASALLEITDWTAVVDATAAPVVVTLPPAGEIVGRVFNVKKTDVSGNAVTVTADGADLIDGAATFPLAAQFDVVTIQSDAAGAWHVLGT